MVKHPQVKDKVRLIVGKYLHLEKPGILEDDVEVPLKVPAPPPGQGSRALWNYSSSNFGPIGLLISRVHCVGSVITPHFIVKCAPHIRFDILSCAKQHLRRHTDDIVTEALSHSISAWRTFYSNCGVIDTAAYHRSMHKLEDHERRALQRVQVLAHWTVQQERFYNSERAGVCPHCGVKASSELHLSECKGLLKFRKSLDENLASLNPSNTPPHLLIGIPEKLTAGLTRHFCSNESWKGELDRDLHQTFLYDAKLTWKQEASIH